MIYGVFYIFSSLTSKNVYKVTRRYDVRTVFDVLFDLMGIFLVILSITIHQKLILIAILIYFILYLMKDARRPVFLDVCSDSMGRKEKATVLSIDSQISALLMVIIAPLFGLIADTLSIQALFLGVGLVMIVVNRFLKLKA